MENFVKTYENFAFCYRKLNYQSEYLKLTEEDRKQVCGNERKNFLDVLNSDEMNFSNFLKLRIANVKSKKQFLKFRENFWWRALSSIRL